MILENSYPAITLYGSETLRTLRVHWALSELSLNYEVVNEPPRSQYTKSPDYRIINPTGQIPALKIGNVVITESAAICLYLFEMFSDESAIDKHVLYQWCFYAMTELDAHTLYILAKHGGQLKDEYGQSDIATGVARNGFHKQVEKLEVRLSDGREFIVGDQFTTADILLTTCILSALNLDLEAPLVVPISCIDYMKRHIERTGYIDATRRNFHK